MLLPKNHGRGRTTVGRPLSSWEGLRAKLCGVSADDERKEKAAKGNGECLPHLTQLGGQIVSTTKGISVSLAWSGIKSSGRIPPPGGPVSIFRRLRTARRRLVNNGRPVPSCSKGLIRSPLLMAGEVAAEMEGKRSQPGTNGG